MSMPDSKAIYYPARFVAAAMAVTLSEASKDFRGGPCMQVGCRDKRIFVRSTDGHVMFDASWDDPLADTPEAVKPFEIRMNPDTVTSESRRTLGKAARRFGQVAVRGPDSGLLTPLMTVHTGPDDGLPICAFHNPGKGHHKDKPIEMQRVIPSKHVANPNFYAGPGRARQHNPKTGIGSRVLSVLARVGEALDTSTAKDRWPPRGNVTWLQLGNSQKDCKGVWTWEANIHGGQFPDVGHTGGTDLPSKGLSIRLHFMGVRAYHDETR